MMYVKNVQQTIHNICAVAGRGWVGGGGWLTRQCTSENTSQKGISKTFLDLGEYTIGLIMQG